MNNSSAVRGCVESVSDNLYVNFNYKTFPRVAVIPEDSHLFIKGWIVDDTRKCAFELGSVYVCIDGREHKAARVRRPDIESALGGKNGQYLWSGFSFGMKLPYVEDGRKHTVNIIAMDPSGNRHRLGDSVELIVRAKSHGCFSGVEKILREHVLHSEDCILHHPFVASVGLEEGIKGYLKTGAESAEQLKSLFGY